VESTADLRQRFKALIQMNKEASASVPENISELVLLDDAVRQLVRICRIVQTPGRHALLIGDSELGKQSLAHLASFIAACHVSYLSLNRWVPRRYLWFSAQNTYEYSARNTQQSVPTDRKANGTYS